jgi:hypothetical protein
VDGPARLSEGFFPTFIVGCERSGTTLLAVMLDRHSQMAVTPETHFLLKIYPRQVWRRWAARSPERLLGRLWNEGRIADLGLDPARMEARFRARPATFPALLQSMMEEYAALRGKPRAGEKTPFHLWQVPRILRWFPEARIVNIIRDGRDTVRSSLKTSWTRRRNLRWLSWRWVQCVRAAERYGRRYPGRFLSIRYEDLLQSPEETLRKVDAFVGLEFEEQQLQPQGDSRTVPQWEEEWKANANKSLDPSRIGAWKKQVTASERLVMNTMMRSALLRQGYGDVELGTASGWAIAWNHFLNIFCRLGFYRLAYNLFGRFIVDAQTPPAARTAGASE